MCEQLSPPPQGWLGCAVFPSCFQVLTKDQSLGLTWTIRGPWRWLFILSSGSHMLLASDTTFGAGCHSPGWCPCSCLLLLCSLSPSHCHQAPAKPHTRSCRPSQHLFHTDSLKYCSENTLHRHTLRRLCCLDHCHHMLFKQGFWRSRGLRAHTCDSPLAEDLVVLCLFQTLSIFYTLVSPTKSSWDSSFLVPPCRFSSSLQSQYPRNMC